MVGMRDLQFPQGSGLKYVFQKFLHSNQAGEYGPLPALMAQDNLSAPCLLAVPSPFSSGIPLSRKWQESQGKWVASQKIIGEHTLWHDLDICRDNHVKWAFTYVSRLGCVELLRKPKPKP